MHNYKTDKRNLLIRKNTSADTDIKGGAQKTCAVEPASLIIFCSTLMKVPSAWLSSRLLPLLIRPLFLMECIISHVQPA